MLRFVNEQKLVPVVDEVFAFEEAEEAFVRMEKGGQFGKLIVEVSQGNVNV